MSDSENNNIRRLDGGLLLIFRELLKRRRATDVAQHLGLSQSAVSHALKRLREIFDDPLFIRLPHGLEPTRRAVELGPRVDSLLDQAASMLASDQGFDIAKTQRQFSVAALDYVMSIFGPGLVEIFQEEAPMARFMCHRLHLDSALSAVRRGEVDLAIGQFETIPAGLRSTLLYKDQYCVVVRQDHPTVGDMVDDETYSKTAHVFVSGLADNMIEGPAHNVEQSLRVYGSIPSPDLVATVACVSQWETALLAVSSTDAMAECPRRLAERYAGPLRLKLLDPPYDPMTQSVQAVRRSEGADAGVDWLLEQVVAVAANL